MSSVIDDKTKKLKLPLPHAANQLQEDLPRLRASFNLLDAAVYNNQEGIKKESQDRAADLLLEAQARAEQMAQLADQIQAIPVITLAEQMAQLADQIQAIPVITVDSDLSDTSENPVQNKIINAALKALQDALAGAGSYPGEFRDFHEFQPLPGWAVRNGALLTSASTAYPALWTALGTIANAWKLKTQSQWTSLNNASPFNGTGGAAFFVRDTGANTIRLPDTRNMFAQGSATNIGVSYRDEIRNITGTWYAARLNYGYVVATGPFYDGGVNSDGTSPASATSKSVHRIGFNASRQVPTGSRNVPAHFNLLGCVYVGGN